MKNNIIKIFVVLLAIVWTSCLDDSKYALDPSTSNNILEFLQPSVPASPFGSIYPAYVQSFPVSTEAQFDRTVSFSGPNGNDKDISLTITVDPAALAEYNQQMALGLNGNDPLNGSTYELLPDDNYELLDTAITIPKGQTKATLSVKIFPDKFDLSKSYALPVRISTASSGIISSNFGVAIFAVVVKNKYDGEYRIDVGSMVETTNPAYVGLYPKNSIYLSTVNANTVNYSDHEYGADHIFFTGTGASQWGGFGAQFAFDDNNNVISVKNKYGQGNNNRSAELNTATGAVNKMTFEADGVTPKTLEVWYIMKQLNGCACDRALWKETFVYVGPRP